VGITTKTFKDKYHFNKLKEKLVYSDLNNSEDIEFLFRNINHENTYFIFGNKTPSSVKGFSID
jgi:hypothetical protein